MRDGRRRSRPRTDDGGPEEGGNDGVARGAFGGRMQRGARLDGGPDRPARRPPGGLRQRRLVGERVVIVRAALRIAQHVVGLLQAPERLLRFALRQVGVQLLGLRAPGRPIASASALRETPSAS